MGSNPTASAIIRKKKMQKSSNYVFRHNDVLINNCSNVEIIETSAGDTNKCVTFNILAFDDVPPPVFNADDIIEIVLLNQNGTSVTKFKFKIILGSYWPDFNLNNNDCSSIISFKYNNIRVIMLSIEGEKS